MRQLPPSEFGSGLESPVAACNDGLREEYRNELIARAVDAWVRWESHQQRLDTIRRFRSEHPEIWAAPLVERLGMIVSAEWLYKELHLVREQFTRFRVDEVAQIRTHPTREKLKEDLLDLNLPGFCREAFERRLA
jgi:hypothetical protein